MMAVAMETYSGRANLTCSQGCNITLPGPTMETTTHAPFWSSEVLIQVVTVMIVMVATVIGNSALIFMLSRKKSRRVKRVNVFIINLAIADLAVAFITMTTEILFAAFREWVLGALLCKLTVYLQVVALSSTTFLLTGMSIDRYQVIVKPLRSLAQRPKISTKVAIAWIMAFVFAIPQCIIFVQEESYDPDKEVMIKTCRSGGYSAEWQRKVYFTFMTAYILVIPSGTMLYCYSKIVKTIFNRGETKGQYLKETVSPRMSLKRSAVSSSRRRVVVMTLSVILAFFVCLMPYFIISLIRIYSNYTLALVEALSISKTIFMMHSALNPIVYGLFTLRKDHLCRMYIVICPCGNRHKANQVDGKQAIKPSRCYKLRRGILFLRKGTRGETSVIIASHAAREETNLMLKNRHCRQTDNFRQFNVYTQCRQRNERGVGSACNALGLESGTSCNSVVPGSDSASDKVELRSSNSCGIAGDRSANNNCVVSVHNPVTPDSVTDVSEV